MLENLAYQVHLWEENQSYCFKLRTLSRLDQVWHIYLIFSTSILFLIPRKEKKVGFKLQIRQEEEGIGQKEHLQQNNPKIGIRLKCGDSPIRDLMGGELESDICSHFPFPLHPSSHFFCNLKQISFSLFNTSTTSVSVSAGRAFLVDCFQNFLFFPRLTYFIIC